MSGRLPYLTAKLQGFGTTVFAEMSALAVATGSVNLGQGFPDYHGPPEVLDAAIAAIDGGQPVPARARACRCCARRSPSTSSGSAACDYDPDTEVLVTAGATEALAGALLALLDTGDEVVLFEPMYDCYPAAIAMAGAVARPVTLRPDATARYGFDPASCAPRSRRRRSCCCSTPRTTRPARCSTRDELALVADLAVANDLIVADRRGLRAPGVRRRRARPDGDAARHARAHAGDLQRRQDVQHHRLEDRLDLRPAPLVAAVRTAKQFLTYVNGGPFQPAIAAGLRLGDDYFSGVAADLEARRDVLDGRPDRRRLRGVPPGGTYFATVDVRPVQPDGDGWRSAARCRSAAAWSPSRTWCSTTRRTRRRPAPGALRVLQARRGARRGRRSALKGAS